MSNFFGGVFFDGGFFGAVTPPTPPDTAVKTGTGGIDPGEGQKRVNLPYKPTGLVDRPRKEGRKEVQDRVDESRQLQAEIAAKLAREFSEQTEEIKVAQDILEMSMSEVDAEIGRLLHKKMRTQEDEVILLMLMVCANA